MQLNNFNIFLREIIQEGNRLQKHDINGKLLTKNKFTEIQYASIVISVISLFFLRKGFTDNFAGYIISFLGIFIGLFSNIVISMYDKRKTLFENYNEVDQNKKAHILKVKNYLVQFTGLTSYSILLAVILIILLIFVLLFHSFQNDIWDSIFIRSFSELNINSVWKFSQNSFYLIHRFLIIYFLINFFSITIFSITSYFSFLLSEYKNFKF